VRKALTIFLFFCVGSSVAQTTYTFTGNGNWSNAANWQNNIVPPAPVLPNSIINIHPVSGGQCIVDIPVTIPPTVTLIILPGSQFVIQGNLTVLSGSNSRGRLSKVWQLYINTSGGYDTVASVLYSYDSQNRLISREDCEYNNNNTADTGYFEKALYAYTNSDTLAWRKIRKSGTLDTTFYVNYPDGRRASDSVVYGAPYYGYKINRYVYDADTIRIKEKRWYPDQSLTSYTRTLNAYQEKLNGNVIHQFDTGLYTTYRYGSSTGSSNISLHIYSSHLSAGNPFYIAMKGCRQLYLEAELGMELDYTPKNLLSYQHKISSTQDVEETHAYIFNGDLPVEAAVTNTQYVTGYPPRTDSYKLIFIYE